MRLNFLCPHHRQSLMDRPELARELWLESASRIARGSSPPTPLQVNLAGSALEAAGIYLESAGVVDAELIRRYANSAIELIKMLGTLRQRHLCVVVVSGATAMVEHLARNGANRQASLTASRRLNTVARAVLGTRVPRPSPDPVRNLAPVMAAVASTTIH